MGAGAWARGWAQLVGGTSREQGTILEFCSKVLEFQGYMDVNWQVIVSSGKASW